MTPSDPEPPAMQQAGDDGADPALGALEEELAARLVRRDLRPLTDNFDPEDRSIEGTAWLAHGLPPRPAEAAARALWADMVRGVTEVRLNPAPTFRQEMRFSSPRALVAEAEAPVPLLRGGRMGTSFNWCGAAILARGGRRFVQVLAEWEVPSVTAGRGPGPFVCSTWIGLDGLRRWMDSMPQMGTTQVVGETGGTDNLGNLLPTYFVWWQWWLRARGRQYPVVIERPIAPGNRVYCCITRLPPDQPVAGARDHVQFFFRNADSSAADAIEVKPPGGRPAQGNPPARGASAQWVLECPTALVPSPNGNVRANNLYPLPDFGEAGANRFAAVLADEPSAVIADVTTTGAPELDPQSVFRSPRKLRMIERRDDPDRIAVIAVPVEARGDRIRVRYKG